MHQVLKRKRNAWNKLSIKRLLMLQDFNAMSVFKLTKLIHSRNFIRSHAASSGATKGFIHCITYAVVLPMTSKHTLMCQIGGVTLYTSKYLMYNQPVSAIDKTRCVLSQGDLGGTRTLQKKWTTFQKARLECSLPERHVSFNNLRAVYTLPGQDWRGTTFYGIFHAQW